MQVIPLWVALKKNAFSAVSVQLYSPRRPLVDTAEVFLWLIAVGTIVCASYWSAWSAREAAVEQDKLLKVISFGARSAGLIHYFPAILVFYFWQKVSYLFPISFALLQDDVDEVPNTGALGAGGVVDINTTSAILFVFVASCFLVILYKLMSSWFVELLVVLFCIGGVEVFVLF